MTTHLRHVIITGANSGIGKAAAVKFASEGHQVVMACRNMEKSRAAQADICKASGNDTVELMQVDVSSLESVAAFCAAYRERYGRLDVLVHNAGWFNHGLTTYQSSVDGLEMSFAANVFGPFLMTELLADMLAESADARIVHACSTNIKNFFDPKRAIEFDNLRGEHEGTRKYASYRMYGDSKMGQLLLVYKLAEVYRAQGIKVTALMIPATRVSADTMQKFRGIYRIIGPLIQNLNPWTREPEDIAACYYAMAVDDRFKDVSGALVNAKLDIVQPAESDGPLLPWKLIDELLNTRHTPAYANRASNIEQMWELSRKATCSIPRYTRDRLMHGGRHP